MTTTRDQEDRLVAAASLSVGGRVIPVWLGGSIEAKTMGQVRMAEATSFVRQCHGCTAGERWLQSLVRQNSRVMGLSDLHGPGTPIYM